MDPGFKPAESFGILMYADGLDEPEGRSAIVCGNQGYQGSPVPVFFENRPAEAGDRVGLLLDLTDAGRLTVFVNDVYFGHLDSLPAEFETPPLAAGPLCWVVEFSGGEGSVRIERKPVPDVPEPGPAPPPGGIGEEEIRRMARDAGVEAELDEILAAGMSINDLAFRERLVVHMIELMRQARDRAPAPVAHDVQQEPTAAERDEMTWGVARMFGVEDFYEEMLAEGGTMDDVRADIFERVGMRL